MFALWYGIDPRRRCLDDFVFNARAAKRLNMIADVRKRIKGIFSIIGTLFNAARGAAQQRICTQFHGAYVIFARS